jgi:MFS family permease
MDNRKTGIFSLVVFVAALGYFVDIYDLLLFSIIRVPSLKSLGLTNINDARDKGELILSIQMVGLLIGGIIWGIVGDKKGRLSVLFGSILLYSLANIANGFVQTVEQYATVRFIAGLGLAGELGAGITLVSELTSKEKRGIATSLVAGLGLTGAIFAFVIKQNFDWRVCYFIGGGLGFVLLILRISVFESGMYNEVKKMNVKRGNFLMLITNKHRLKKYLATIAVGLPSWLVVGILLTFCDSFGIAMNMKSPVDPGKAVMFSYIGVSVGGVLIGFISQWLRSRKKAIYIFYAITITFIILFFTVNYNSNPIVMYIIAFGLGFGTGFWAIFVTMGAEQFGTNLRATAATTVPNFVRGTVPLMVGLFKLLRGTDPTSAQLINAAEWTCIIIMIFACAGTIFIKETFNNDLNFVEN